MKGQAQVIPFPVARKSPGVTIVRRPDLGKCLFTAQQRAEIVHRFFRQHHSVKQISDDFRVGHLAIQDVIRFSYWTSVGQRKQDIEARRAA